MGADLSPTEKKVATEYCRGFNDSEVADSLGMMVWTTRTHKKRIFQKWGINTTHEMVLLCIAKIKNQTIDIREIRDKGISIFFLCLVIFQMVYIETDYARTFNNIKVARTTRASRARRSKDGTIDYNTFLG